MSEGAFSQLQFIARVLAAAVVIFATKLGLGPGKEI